MITIDDIKNHEEDDEAIFLLDNPWVRIFLCYNTIEKPESEYIRIYLDKLSHGYNRFVNISLYQPIYIGSDEFSKTKLNIVEKDIVVQFLNNNWNTIISKLKSKYKEDLYVEFNKDKISYPDIIPDYTLLEVI